MFNREQFLMTGVVFLWLAGTSLFLSGATVLRNQEFHSNQVTQFKIIEQETDNLTPILDNVPAESNNSDSRLQVSSRTRSNSVAAATDVDVQNNIMYSADFNNIVEIRAESDSLSNEAVIAADNEVRERERNRLNELRARNQSLAALNETDTTDSEPLTSADRTANNESGHDIEAKLEPARESHCVNVWNELEHEELSHTVCIELYRDNGDNVPDSENDTLVGFTLSTNHLSEDGPDNYEFNNLPAGNYFAKFYHLGQEAPVFQAIQTVADANDKLTYNSWETTLIEATAVDAGYGVRFDREENSEASELNGLTVVPSWGTD